MNFKKILLSAAIATAITWSGANTAEAQTTNPERIVYFTFTQPVTIPGSTLPAGRYRFQILQSFTDRGILRIQNEDSSRTFGTILVVPTSRTDVVAAPELRFLETASTAPPAIGSYWMPATGIGWEFVYPKDQATELAINTKSPVLTGPAGNLAQQTTVTGLTRTAPTGQSAAYVPSTVPTPVSGGLLRGSTDPADNSVAEAAAAQNANRAASVEPRRSAVAQNNAAAAPPVTSSDNETTRSNRATLPATAGTSPLAAIAGILALAAALGLGAWRRFA